MTFIQEQRPNFQLVSNAITKYAPHRTKPPGKTLAPWLASSANEGTHSSSKQTYSKKPITYATSQGIEIQILSWVTNYLETLILARIP